MAALESPIETRAHWFGDPEHASFGWLSQSTISCSERAVLILPPLGYEYWSAHGSLRALAEGLARAGHLVMRLDYRGTADAVGQQWDAAMLASWRQDIGHAVEELRRMGAKHLSLIGLRVGATLALLMAQQVQADAVVAWMAVASGRRYVKELQLLSMGIAPELGHPAGAGARCMAGSVFSAECLADLAALTCEAVQTDARVLVLDRPDKASNLKLVEQLRAQGTQADHLVMDGAQAMLDLPTEYATVPRDQVLAIVDWVGQLEGPASLPLADGATTWQTHLAATDRTCLSVEIAGGQGRQGVEETALRLGPSALVGIQARAWDPEPSAPQQASRACVVLLNTGSEPHVGPGRAWVEIARQLAARHCTVIRADYRGWGESPDQGHAPGRPYDAHTVEDTRDIVEALVARGEQRIIVVGLCAGAWAALRRCASLPIQALVAFNPQLYWQPGDPVYATIPEDVAWRKEEAKRNPQWVQAGRQAVYAWLQEIRQAPYPVDFWFSPQDVGLHYIQGLMGDALAELLTGALHIHGFAHLDHAMHLHWHRDEAIAAIMGMVERLERVG